MAIILEFPSRRDPPAADLRRRQLATIIIFPGTRIERSELSLERGKSLKGAAKHARPHVLDRDDR
jgi:hypothetical protein